jgi:hypothetical protein
VVGGGPAGERRRSPRDALFERVYHALARVRRRQRRSSFSSSYPRAHASKSPITMSAVTFPHGFPAHSPSFAEDDYGEHSYAMLSGGSMSGFQMNPLSIHPPRTPRTSIVAGRMPEPAEESVAPSPSARAEFFTAHGDEQMRHSSPDVEEVKPTRAKPARAHVRREEVWREILKTSNGRDKALVSLRSVVSRGHAQRPLAENYTVHDEGVPALPQHPGRARISRCVTTMANRDTPPPKFNDGRPLPRAVCLRPLPCVPHTQPMLNRARATPRRKCLILFNWLPPLTGILAENAASVDSARALGGVPPAPKPLLHTFLHAPPPVLLELLNALADDTATWARLGVLSTRTGQRAARVADWCWFASTLVALVENGVERGVIVGSRRAGAFGSLSFAAGCLHVRGSRVAAVCRLDGGPDGQVAAPE